MWLFKKIVLYMATVFKDIWVYEHWFVWEVPVVKWLSSKWTRWHEFKSWTRLIAFHIALMPLGKVRIQLFSLQLWVNSRRDCVLQPCEATSRGEGTLNSNLLNSAWKLILCHILPERRGSVYMDKYIHPFTRRKVSVKRVTGFWTC